MPLPSVDRRGAAGDPHVQVGVADRRQARDRTQRHARCRRSRSTAPRPAAAGRWAATRASVALVAMSRRSTLPLTMCSTTQSRTFGAMNDRPQPLQRRRPASGCRQCRARGAARRRSRTCRTARCVTSFVAGAPSSLVPRSPCSSVMRCWSGSMLPRITTRLSTSRLVVGRQRIEHDPAAAEREHASCRRAARAPRTRSAACSARRPAVTLNGTRSVRRATIPVEPEFRGADRNAGAPDRPGRRSSRPRRGSSRTASAALPSAAMSESIEADTSVSERSRVSAMRSASRSSSRTLRASSCRRRWPCAPASAPRSAPRPLLVLRQHG